MEKKFLTIIGAVFIVLAVIASFPWLEKKFFGEKKYKPVSGMDFSVFAPESVDKISIAKGDSKKTLFFKDNKWFVGENEADQKKVEGLFDNFSKLKTKEIVSQNESNFSKFETVEDSGIKLVVFQNGQENVFFVGKAGSSPGDFYLRKDGSKNVYLVFGGDFREKLLWEESKWKLEEKEDKNPIEE